MLALNSYTVQESLPREWCFPQWTLSSQIQQVRTTPTEMLIGQLNEDRPLLKFLYYVILACIKLANKVNHHSISVCFFACPSSVSGVCYFTVDFLKKDLFTFLCMHLCSGLSYIYVVPVEAILVLPAAGVAVMCKLLDVGVGIQTQVHHKSKDFSEPMSHLSRPK